MSISLKFWLIHCCFAAFLLLAQNVNSLSNTNSHHKPRKPSKLPINLSNLTFEDGGYTMLVTGGYTIPMSRLQTHIVSIRTTRATAYFGDNHFCCGTIISSNLILTAAHCVIDRRKIITRQHRLVVVAGAPNRLVKQKTTIEMQVLAVRPHHKFIREGAHDIAILRLARSFPDDNDSIKVIPLFKGKIPNGTVCRIIGWGRVFDRGPYSAHPIHGAVTVFSYDYCKKFYPDIFDETMICAGKKDTWDVDTCRGDSGGPLICRGQVAAVVSWGSYCGTANKPTVFSSIYHHRDWIRVTSGTKVVKSLNALYLLLYILCIHIYF
ncbi:glandular kallikrein, prostatic [Zeugodacus cucurbitae]|nr:glandular kallikrein, prostatic [Zeugodacus cucurbitae]